MFKRLLDTPINTTALQRVLQVAAVVVTIGCAVTVLLMAKTGYSLGAVLLAAVPFVLVKVALMILIRFSK
jgi:pantothenate kinase type III